MMAAVLQQFGCPLVFESLPDPEPGPEDVVLRVVTCGIDGTDLKLLEGVGYSPQLPFVMGHEPAGIVESVGSQVQGWNPGDRAIPYIFVIPRTSSWYQSAREQLCPEMTGVVGVKGIHGGYAEKLCLPASQLARVPPQVHWDDAAVLCDAGLTAWHAVRRARIALGETVLVIGVGGVGGFLLQFARMAGATVFAVETSPAKCERAKRLGAMDTVDASQKSVADAVRAWSVGQGVDCVVDIVGSADTLESALDCLRPGGRLVVVGYTADRLVAPAKRLAQNELEVLGSRGGTRRDLNEVLEHVAGGRVQSIVTDTLPWLQVNEALDRLRQGDVLGRLVLQVSPDDRNGGKAKVAGNETQPG